MLQTGDLFSSRAPLFPHNARWSYTGWRRDEQFYDGGWGTEISLRQPQPTQTGREPLDWNSGSSVTHARAWKSTGKHSLRRAGAWELSRITVFVHLSNSGGGQYLGNPNEHQRDRETRDARETNSKSRDELCFEKMQDFDRFWPSSQKFGRFIDHLNHRHSEKYQEVEVRFGHPFRESWEID
nr:hypothetical protein Itr_chr15CG13040 [Ipomoea trifida]